MANRKKCRVDVLSIILSSLLNYSLVVGANNKCLRINDSPCSCKFENGSIIDLSSISPSSGDEWSRKPTNTKDNSEYFYNPCVEFKMGNEGCSKVTICQKQGDSYFGLGDTNDVIFDYNEDLKKIQIKYHKGERTTNVTLVCSDEPTQLVVEGETKPGESQLYLMTLTSKCACPDGCLNSDANGLSTGSVLIILLFVFSSIYFLGGMVYLKIVRGASGFEMIPHYEFWLDFPLLVRDGVIFLLSGCRAETTYERI